MRMSPPAFAHRPPRLRLPRRTARLRLTALYAALFLLSGAALLAITYLLAKHAIGAASPPGAQRPLGVHALPVAPEQVRGLQAAAAKRQSISDLNHLRIDSAVALAIVAVLAVVLGWLVAGRVLRPLTTITATARRISASNLHERLDLRGADAEFKELGDTLDELLARLQASFHAQRRFIANASHELRTPLTAERTLLQVALEDPATTTDVWRATSQELLSANQEQERLIEGLLTLATSEGGLDHRERIDLTDLTERILITRHPDIERLGLQVQVAMKPAALDGDRLLVERLVANLIDNAVRHNVTGGRVEIATGIKHGRGVLSVANTGPVIPPTHVERLFQPFQRLNPRRIHSNSGHGLGLSIVRAIATAHGATLTAHARPDGGLTIDVSFPPAATPDHAPNNAAGPHSPPTAHPTRTRPAP
jgi:signal transduction histidine kinase